VKDGMDVKGSASLRWAPGVTRKLGVVDCCLCAPAQQLRSIIFSDEFSRCPFVSLSHIYLSF